MPMQELFGGRKEHGFKTTAEGLLSQGAMRDGAYAVTVIGLDGVTIQSTAAVQQQ